MKSIKNFVRNHVPIRIQVLHKSHNHEDDRFYAYQKDYVDFTINPGDRILDIGSGGYPFPLATHLADSCLGETPARSEQLVIDTRPFILCNLENMPFTDKAFDFVYCSHLLEHVDHPAKACGELMRIGRRGYIETPTRMSDIMFNFARHPHLHRWHTVILGKTLVFMEWKDSERRDTGTDYFFHQFLSTWKNPFQQLVCDNRQLFVNMLLWETDFDYVVIDKTGKIANLSRQDVLMG